MGLAAWFEHASADVPRFCGLVAARGAMAGWLRQASEASCFDYADAVKDHVENFLQGMASNLLNLEDKVNNLEDKTTRLEAGTLLMGPPMVHRLHCATVRLNGLDDFCLKLERAQLAQDNSCFLMEDRLRQDLEKLRQSLFEKENHSEAEFQRKKQQSFNELSNWRWELASQKLAECQKSVGKLETLTKNFLPSSIEIDTLPVEANIKMTLDVENKVQYTPTSSTKSKSREKAAQACETTQFEKPNDDDVIEVTNFKVFESQSLRPKSKKNKP